MNNAQLSALEATMASLAKTAAHAAVTSVSSVLPGAFAGGETVATTKFRTFPTRSRPARQGHNRRPGECITITALIRKRTNSRGKGSGSISTPSTDILIHATGPKPYRYLTRSSSALTGTTPIAISHQSGNPSEALKTRSDEPSVRKL